MDIPEPRVLVLLAARNGAAWIQEQVLSILEQQAVRLHIVIQDDNSSDNTVSTVIPMTAADPRVELRTNTVSSGSAAQNFFSLIRSTDAPGFDFVALADQDDIWDASKLRTAIQVLKKAGAHAYSGAVTAFWSHGRSVTLEQCPEKTESDFLFEGAGQGCSFVITADFYSRLRNHFISNPGLTSAIHYHDWSIYALSRVWGLSWAFDPHPSMRYRQHDENDTGARTSLAGVLKRLVKIRNGWYQAQLLAIAKLCLEARPESEIVSRWLNLLSSPQTLRRRLNIALFCARGGRRRKSDNAMLVASALAGWI